MGLDVRTALALREIFDRARRTITVNDGTGTEELTYLDADEVIGCICSEIDAAAQREVAPIIGMNLEDAERWLQYDSGIPSYISSEIFAFPVNGKWHPDFLAILRARDPINERITTELQERQPKAWAVNAYRQDGQVAVAVNADGYIIRFDSLVRR